MTEMKLNSDHEKAQLMHEMQAQKDKFELDRQREWEVLREQLQGQLADAECRLKDKQEKDAKVSAICTVSLQVLHLMATSKNATMQNSLDFLAGRTHGFIFFKHCTLIYTDLLSIWKCLCPFEGVTLQ